VRTVLRRWLKPVALAGGMALAAAGMGGCALRGGAAVSSGAEQQFVTQVHSQAPDIASYRTDIQLLRLGQTVCSDLEANASVAEVADRIPLVEGSNPLPPAELGAVIAAAVSSLCPQFHGKLNGGGTNIP
jgi:hypothetical protein